MSNDTEKFLTLKEAAKISGYSPDYVGQLIRQGKLEGKQVFKSVSWVTTEEALRAYLSDKQGLHGTPRSEFISPEYVSYLYRGFSIIMITLGVLFLLLMMYIFSVSIDQHIQQTNLEKKVYAE